MSSSEPGERAQCSVAELLARYGETPPATGRRRRRTPDDDYTDPHAIIQRVQTDSGPLPALGEPRRRRAADSSRESSHPGFSHRESGLPSWDGGGRTDPSDRGWGSLDSQLSGSGTFDNPSWASLPDQAPRSGAAAPNSAALNSATDRTGLADRSPTGLDGPEREGYRTRFGDESSWMDLPLSAGPPPFTDRRLSPGQPTDQLPRLAPELWTPDPVPPQDSQLTAGEPPAGLADPLIRVAEPPAGLAEPPTRVAEPPAGLAEPPTRVAGPPAGLGAEIPSAFRRDDTDPRFEQDLEPSWDDLELLDGVNQADDYLEDDEHPEAEQSRSPMREWIVMASQVCVGVVGGAVLWLICEWLWQRTPVVALVVALAVITGLVWVVRRVRRAEDLQTTVIAVLVGLFVTVSPAALLLVGR